MNDVLHYVRLGHGHCLCHLPILLCSSIGAFIGTSVWTFALDWRALLMAVAMLHT